MSSIETIRDSNQLAKVLELSQDKLVIILYYGKGIPQCKYARKAHEQLAMKHTLSIFCMIDIENFEGDDRVINSGSNLPYFDFYYQTAKMGSFQGYDLKELDQRITSNQQYIMTQINQKNNMNQMYNQSAQSGMTHAQIQQNQQQYAQIQSQILNGAMTNNPQLYKQFIQNPQILNQAVNQQLITMQQQAVGQMGQVNQVNQMGQFNQMNQMVRWVK